jgi:hypothetical protein
MTAGGAAADPEGSINEGDGVDSRCCQTSPPPSRISSDTDSCAWHYLGVVVCDSEFEFHNHRIRAFAWLAAGHDAKQRRIFVGFHTVAGRPRQFDFPGNPK